MKKIILFLLVFIPVISLCQSNTGMPAGISNNPDSLFKLLQKKLDSIEGVLKDLSATNAQNSAEDYSKSYKNALISIDLLSTLSTTVKSINADRNQAEAQNIITQINNPASNQLGFVFTDQILTYANRVISAANIYDEQKAKLRSTISTIVEGLKNSFPPLNIVTSVISSFASFNIPFIEKLSKKMKKGDTLAIRAITPVTENMLKQFSSSIMPYVHFYEKLNNVSLLFSNDLNLHKAKYQDYFPAVNALTSRYRAELNIDVFGVTGMPKDRVDLIYENTDGRKGLNYKIILNRPDVKKLNEFSIQTIQLAQEFKAYYNDYYRILLKNYDDNLSMLKQSKSLAGSNAQQIDVLIEKLNTLRKGTNENDPGFEVKFKTNLEMILSRLSQLFVL